MRGRTGVRCAVQCACTARALRHFRRGGTRRSRGGVVFAVVFLLPWWKIATPGAHFVLSLFAFDAGFTWVMLAQVWWCGAV